MIEVKLEPWQIMHAAHAGMMRQTQNLKLKSKPGHGADDFADWQLHCEGACAEYVVAQFLRLFWPGKGSKSEADVGGIVDVRWAQKPHYGLILHDDDPDDRPTFLVTGRNGVYQIRGWLYAGEGKKRENWKDPGTGRPAYFVKQELLRPPESLVVTIDASAAAGE